MSKYVAIITSDHWTPKNKPHQFARIVASEMHATLLADRAAVLDFKKSLEKKISAINTANPRANDLVLQYETTFAPRILLYLPNNFIFTFFPIAHDTIENR